MRGGAYRGTFARMTLWMLTIAICPAVWVLGSAVVVHGATWIVRHQPH
jgi:hypothetical protein